MCQLAICHCRGSWWVWTHPWSFAALQCSCLCSLCCGCSWHSTAYIIMTSIDDDGTHDFWGKKKVGGQAAWISFWVGLCRVLLSKCSIMTWLWHGTTCTWAESRHAQSCLVTSASSRPPDGSSFSCDNLSLATSFSYCWDWRCICCGHSYPFALHAWSLGPWNFCC